MRASIIKRGVFNFLKANNLEHIVAEQPGPKDASVKKDFEVHYPVHLETTINLIRNHIFSNQDTEKASAPKSMLDCTLGTGGHTKLLLDSFPNLHILGIDIDNRMVDYVNQNLKEGLEPSKKQRLVAQTRNFNKIDLLSPYKPFPEVFRKKDMFDCILADLGYNSLQLEGEDWGLAYNIDQALDMRYNKETMKTTAADLVNEAHAYDLKEMFTKFGQEPAASHIAKVIVEERKKGRIETTKQLKDVIFSNLNPRADKYKVLMRVFQALRIAINNELVNLEEFLDKIMTPLQQDGLGIIITFHSLEHQMVSQKIKELKKQAKVKVIESGLVPSEKEILTNSRSKSAKLYCFQKIAP